MRAAFLLGYGIGLTGKSVYLEWQNANAINAHLHNQDCGYQARPESTPIAPIELLPLVAAQTCSDPTKNRLRQAQKNACIRPRKCNLMTPTETVHRNILRNQECARARMAVMNQCFGGGDQRHARELARVQKTLVSCLSHR